MQQMKTSLCLQAQHLPASRHHKNVVMHSSIRLPPVQANNGSPPGAARVVVVGAGVVLACALGTMYWKRARALPTPTHLSSFFSYTSGNSDDQIQITSADVSMEKLPGLLSEICIKPSDPMRSNLTELIHKCLTKKDRENVKRGQELTSVLQKKFLTDSTSNKIGEVEYIEGLVLSLAHLTEKNYVEAEKICNLLKDSPVSPRDPRHHLLLAIIYMMMTMDKMVKSPSNPTASDLKLNEVKKEWEDFRKKYTMLPAAPPPVQLD